MEKDKTINISGNTNQNKLINKDYEFTVREPYPEQMSKENTYTTILRPLHRSTCASWHTQLAEDFVKAKF